MGYRKIENLYKDIRILDFKECYALEKIHGTSAHITYKDNALKFFSGGAKHETFVELFDQEELIKIFEIIGCPEVTVYGEAYGGKIQGMSKTYGKELKFIAFEVRIGDAWLAVANAHDVASKLRIGFVSYVRGPATLEWLNYMRDYPSAQAHREGCDESSMREGIVIRPIKEYRDYRGNRVITKHKRDEFKETKTKREVAPEKLAILEKADEIAREWVTPMRMAHVLDKLSGKGEMKHVPIVIKAMIEDIKIEGEGEITWSKSAEKAIGKEIVMLYKKTISLLPTK